MSTGCLRIHLCKSPSPSGISETKTQQLIQTLPGTIQNQTHNSANASNMYQFNTYNDLKKTNQQAVNILMAVLIPSQATLISLI